MDKCKNARKGIIQLEWEHKMRRMQIEDLNNKAKDIQMLQLSEVQRDVSIISILNTTRYFFFAFLRDLFLFLNSQSATLRGNDTSKALKKVQHLLEIAMKSQYLQ